MITLTAAAGDLLNAYEIESIQTRGETEAVVYMVSGRVYRVVFQEAAHRKGWIASVSDSLDNTYTDDSNG